MAAGEWKRCWRVSAAAMRGAARGGAAEEMARRRQAGEIAGAVAVYVRKIYTQILFCPYGVTVARAGGSGSEKRAAEEAREERRRYAHMSARAGW